MYFVEKLARKSTRRSKIEKYCSPLESVCEQYRPKSKKCEVQKDKNKYDDIAQAHNLHVIVLVLILNTSKNINNNHKRAMYHVCNMPIPTPLPPPPRPTI